MATEPANRPRFRRATFVGVVALLLLGSGIAVAQSPFVDISGNTHEDNIHLAYELGLTSGTTATTYSPSNNVRRDQMASFLINTLEHTHPQMDIDWLLQLDSEAFVLPDGTTFTDDDEPMDEPDEDEFPPVGSRLIFTDNVWSVDAEGDPQDVIGTSHGVCTAGVEEGRFTCDVMVEVDDEGGLVLAASFNFLDFAEDEGFGLDLAVTGGTGAFHGATGELAYLEEDEELASVTGTLVLHDTR